MQRFVSLMAFRAVLFVFGASTFVSSIGIAESQVMRTIPSPSPSDISNLAANMRVGQILIRTDKGITNVQADPHGVTILNVASGHIEGRVYWPIAAPSQAPTAPVPICNVKAVQLVAPRQTADILHQRPGSLLVATDSGFQLVKSTDQVVHIKWETRQIAPTATPPPGVTAPVPGSPTFC